MLSNRPYLLRAFYQWIVDSACTPILVVDANNPRCKIPRDYVDEGEIVFNISASAIRDLKMLNDVIEFRASFTGTIYMISVPVNAVLSVYAEENGEGLFFDADEDLEKDVNASQMVQLKSIDGFANENREQRGQRDQVVCSQESVAKPKPFLKLVE